MTWRLFERKTKLKQTQKIRFLAQKVPIKAKNQALGCAEQGLNHVQRSGFGIQAENEQNAARGQFVIFAHDDGHMALASFPAHTPPRTCHIRFKPPATAGQSVIGNESSAFSCGRGPRCKIPHVSFGLILVFCDGFQERKVISFIRKRKCKSQRVQ